MKTIQYLVLALIFMIPTGATLAADSFVGRVDHFVVCDGANADGALPDFAEAGCQTETRNSLDPQDRLIWARARVEVAPGTVSEEYPYALLISAMASTEVYWNGEFLGANGTPGSDSASEVPGLMDVTIYLPSSMIREGTNILALRMSSFHNPARVRVPIHGIGIYRYQSPIGFRLRGYIPALITAGGLFLGTLYFGMAFALDRRQVGALFLALMSASAIGQLGVEALRGFIAYPYTFHVVRLMGIIGFAFAFGLSLVGYVTWRFSRSHIWLALGLMGLIGSTAIWISPSYDMKTVSLLLTACGLSLGFLVPCLKSGGMTPRLIATALAIFVTLIFIRQSIFLDQDFYYAVFVLAAILFIGELMARRQDQAEREEANTRAARLELELLRRQISPHFLMNTLNVLSAWVEQDKHVSVDIIETLASECRTLDDLSRKQLVPLVEELALCKTHLKLMSFRTEAPFALETTGAVTGKLVPPATILTLIENAFSHNQYPDGADFHLGISDMGSATMLIFSAPIAAKNRGGQSHGGIGLSYVRARLNDAFGSHWTLDDGPDDTNHWRVAVSYG